MASRYFLLRSFKKPIFFFNHELKSKLNKSVYFDFNNSNSLIKFKFYLLFCKQSSYRSKIRFFCVLSGKTRALDNDFSFSRFAIKTKIAKGSVTGYKKSSW